jgi:hypothetical protein
MNDEQLMIVQGLVDRLLYLKEKDKEEFPRYLDMLYEVYPIPRKILYGREALMAEKKEDE